MDLRISNTYQQSNYNYSPNFKSTLRTVKNADGKLLWRNTTNFFREDLPWKEMVEYFALKYANVNKVRVLCYGCSDGSEPISLAMLLLDKLGKNADKFFPIMAMDIDEDIIKKASSGRINVDCKDKVMMNNILYNDASNYLELPNFKTMAYGSNVKVKDCIKDVIHYSVADIRDEVHTIPHENTIVFARNFWPYLGSGHEVGNLARNLRTQLQKNCTLVVGDFDTFAGIQSSLILAEFETSPLSKNIYEPRQQPLFYGDTLYNFKFFKKDAE